MNKREIKNDILLMVRYGDLKLSRIYNDLIRKHPGLPDNVFDSVLERLERTKKIVLHPDPDSDDEMLVVYVGCN